MKRKMKKTMAAFVTMAMAVSMLVGCGSGSSDSGTGSKTVNVICWTEYACEGSDIQ